METLLLRAQYKYNPEQLAHIFFGQILKQWPGYRITDYAFLGGNIIEVSLSR